MPRPSPPFSPSFFNSLIAARARAGRTTDAVSLLARMHDAGVAPSAFSFAPILSSPALGLRCATQLYPLILKNGLLHADPYCGTALVGFFARNARFGDALQMFEEMPVRSIISWNCLISSFARHGCNDDAVFWFRELVRSGTGLSEGSLVGVLPAFGLPEQVHGLAVKIGMDTFLAVATSLLDSYSSCSSVRVAEKLFDSLMVRDVFSWNAMITAFSRSNLPERAFELFLRMQLEGVLPNEAALSSVLHACGRINAPECGKFVHAKAIKCNLETSLFVNSALVDFYAKCGGRTDARRAFKEMPEQSTASWNALISCHSEEDAPTPLVTLKEMLCSRIRPNEVSFSSLLKRPPLLDLLQIHSLIIRLGYDSNYYVLSAIISSYAMHGIVSDVLVYGVAINPEDFNFPINALAAAYNKAREYQQTKQLLLRCQDLDSVSWSILITACARNGDFVEAFEYSKQMRILGHFFDNYVAMSLLSICSTMNSLVLGRLLHGLVIKTNSVCSDMFVQNALLEMYAKCGRIEDCLKAFEEMEDRNLISWTTVISGLGLNGFPHKATNWFKAMEKDGFKPDKVALLALLSACRHGGLVEEGMQIFRRMKDNYGLEAEMDHYICVVDMLCKRGHVKEAELVIRGMPFRPSAVIWRTFLQGCKRYGSTDR